MPRTTKKRAFSVIKVYPADMEWIRGQQYRLRDPETGLEPAQPQIIATLVEMAKRINSTPPDTPQQKGIIYMTTFRLFFKNLHADIALYLTTPV